MIQQRDIDQIAGSFDLPRDLLIVRAWPGLTRWVIVTDDDARRILQQRHLYDFAGENHRLSHRALKANLAADESIPSIEEDGHHGLPAPTCQHGL